MIRSHCPINFIVPISFLFVLQTAALVSAQDSASRLSADERRQIINDIGDMLVKNYVFAEPAKTSREFLARQLEDGAYTRVTHPRQFAEKLTADLYTVLKDKHVRVESLIPAEENLQQENPLLSFLLQTRQKYTTNQGIEQVKTFDANIGYMNLTSFEPLEWSQPVLDAAMNLLHHADALIIDLRRNSGGNPATVQYLCSYFINEPVLLNSFYWRRDNYTEEFWNLDQVGGKKRPDLPLFILTGPFTFSAAEEFVYNLQAQQRVTVIGESTAGGANPGFTFQINPRFTIFIPVGRAINPLTGTNWEGRGVEPDIRIESSTALNVALDKARQAARIHREKSDDRAFQLYLELIGRLKQAELLSTVIPADSTEKLIRTALLPCVNADVLDEWSVNSLGYRYLNQKNFPLAIALLKFNCLQYPRSANVYDSLGEAYYLNGDKHAAIQNYLRSLELNPKNHNAQIMLEKLGYYSVE
jgi:tetratricopeptide (TPR) repeat protein